MTADDNVELVNVFIRKYNQQHDTNDHMFSGINDKNPTSTNKQLEQFHAYMEEHKTLQKDNPSYVDIDYPDTYQENPKYKTYCAVNNSGDVMFKSMSYLSLLKFTNDIFSGVSDNWEIIQQKL